jgi:hypothetical protein
MSKNKISIGGNVGGSVVAGDGNTVDARLPEEPASTRKNGEGLSPRLGFVMDIVGFGSRDAEGKDDLQARLDRLFRQVVDDLGVGPEDTDSSDAGDSRVLFLPPGMDSARVLRTMLPAVTERLAKDNRRYRDTMRLRMAVGTGLVGTGALEFTGELVVDLHRLVDSDVLREAVTANPDKNLALLVSQALHDDVIRPGHLDPAGFTRVVVKQKEFEAPAWLRVC